jgi:hypothetical protein
MKKIIITIQLLLLCCYLFCQTFHKEYNNSGDETTSERTLKLFESNDTTILLCVEKSMSSVYYNLYVDQDGNQIKQVFRDTSTFRPQLIYEMREHTLNARYSSTHQGSMLFNVVDNYGEIEIFKEVDFTSCGISMFYLSDFLETENRYIVSGVIDDGDRAALIFMDHDFNIIECKLTDDTFKDIPSLVQTTDERIFGIMAFTGYDMVDCGTCFYEARFYLAELSEDYFFDTIKVVYEGRSYLDYKIPIESLSDNNILISHELESTDPYVSFTDKLVLKSIDQQGEVNWSVDPLDIIYDGFSSYSFSKDVNNKILFTCETAAANDIGLENSITSIISLISLNGEVLWTKKFLRFVGDLGWTKSDKYNTIFVSQDVNITLSGRHTISQSVEKPILLKLTKDGCFHEDCRKIEATGYFPPPRKMISYRNIWNVHNTVTDERYRYSFVEQAIPDIGGTLLRSDEMSGDNWYSTERQFWGGNRLTAEHGENGYFTDYQYNYDFDVGEFNELVAPPEFDYRKLVTTEKDTIYFNDGRPMRRLKMECYRDDDKMEEYEPITWIELLGDPEHLFDTHNACRERGSEVVTCFYTAGNLMWSHPDYTDCAPTGVEEVSSESAIVFPNPANDEIQVNVNFGMYRIVSSSGQIILTGNAIKQGESIDISHLLSGSYYIYEIDRKDGKVIPFTKF